MIPDGLGGTLALWVLNIEDPDFRFHQDVKVHHTDSSGAVQDFDLPQLVPQSLFDLGAAAQALVLGENNVAFGAGNHSIVGFDVTSGSPVFSFRPQ